MNYTIIQAHIQDRLLIYECFKRCTVMLQHHGIDQWDFSYPTLENIDADIANGSCYLIKLKQGLGIVTINQVQDPQYHSIKWNYIKDPIWVVHRLAVDPAISKRGVAKALCAFTEEFVRNKGGSSIRLDTFSLNKTSNYLYSALGYELAQGFCYFHGNKSPFYCYEKRIQ